MHEEIVQKVIQLNLEIDRLSPFSKLVPQIFCLIKTIVNDEDDCECDGTLQKEHIAKKVIQPSLRFSSMHRNELFRQISLPRL